MSNNHQYSISRLVSTVYDIKRTTNSEESNLLMEELISIAESNCGENDKNDRIQALSPRIITLADGARYPMDGHCHVGNCKNNRTNE